MADGTRPCLTARGAPFSDGPAQVPAMAARNGPRASEALVEAAGALAEDPVEIPTLLCPHDRPLLLACCHGGAAAIDIGGGARCSLTPARGIVLAGRRRLLVGTG